MLWSFKGLTSLSAFTLTPCNSFKKKLSGNLQQMCNAAKQDEG